jgi:hypothetical protein
MVVGCHQQPTIAAIFFDNGSHIISNIPTRRSWQEHTSLALSVSSMMMIQLVPLMFVVIVMVVKSSDTTMGTSSAITILYYVKAGARYKRPP